jgi:hypothetical protein
MDLVRIIYELRQERERILAMIDVLERRGARPPSPPRKRRGRQPMNSTDRQEVSRRMKLYWEKRKQEQFAILDADRPTVGD